MNADNLSNEQEAPNRPLALSLAVAAVAGLIAVVLRLVPLPTGFSAVGACSLFGGAKVKTWHAYLIPLGVMIVSDLLLWLLSGFDFNYSLGHPSRVFVYGSFMIYVLIGRWLGDKDSIVRVSLAATVGGVQFFVLTNFCEWLFQPLYYNLIAEPFRYSRDLNGLLACFVAALPFYQGETPFGEHPFAVLTDFRFSIVWTVLGDILFTTGYILVYAKLKQRAASTEPAAMPVTNA